MTPPAPASGTMVNMATVVNPTITFEEFERLPDSPNQTELLEGELVRMPPPECSHMESSESLFIALRAAIEACRQAGNGDHLGKVHVEMGYLLSPGSWVRPDVSITQPQQPRAKYYEGAPLIAFEIISKQDRAQRLAQKVQLLFRHGAEEVWLIYTETREAHIYRRNSNTILREEASIHSDLLPGIAIPFDQFL